MNDRRGYLQFECGARSVTFDPSGDATRKVADATPDVAACPPHEWDKHLPECRRCGAAWEDQ